jgi:hypothetical protein
MEEATYLYFFQLKEPKKIGWRRWPEMLNTLNVETLKFEVHEVHVQPC